MRLSPFAVPIKTHSVFDPGMISRLSGNRSKSYPLPLIFNAIILIALIPLAIRGVHFRPLTPTEISTRNLFTYGVGEMLLPFSVIKLIDMFVTTLRSGLKSKT